MASARCMGIIFILMTICQCLMETGAQTERELQDADLSLRLGARGNQHTVKEMDGFPDPKTFFEDYVLPSEPLKMNGAAVTGMPYAYHNWNEQYFLDNIPNDTSVIVRVEKKNEIIDHLPINVDFERFIKTYRNENFYIISTMPEFLRKDVTIPWPIQCEPIVDNNDAIVTEARLWMSSGDTTSTLHTDSWDNIMCLLTGVKEWLLIDHRAYGDMAPRMFIPTAYDKVQPEAVDYEEFPELANIGYHRVNISAGDCLFVPYQWLHQVISHDVNLAVNVWWGHFKGFHIDPTTSCAVTPNLNTTLEQLEFNQFSYNILPDDVNDFKEYVTDVLYKTKQLKACDDNLADYWFEEDELALLSGYEDRYLPLLHKLVHTLDLNGDMCLQSEEINEASIKAWTETYHLGIELAKILVEATAAKDRDDSTQEKRIEL